MTTDTNILYGGPDVPFIHNDAKSLGEMIQRQFKENAQNTCFVCISYKKKIASVFLSYGLISIR